MGINYSPKIVTNGLVLCLDAANSLSYPGSGTVWTDLSGNGNHGTLTNGPTYSSSNKGGIVFDGTNDYIDCGKPVSLNFGTGSFSICFWIKPSSGNIVKLLGSKGANGNNGWWMALDNRYNSNTEGVTFSAQSVTTNGNYAAKGTTSSFKYNINQWNYLVGVWDTISKDLLIFINSNLTTTTIVQSGGTGISGVTDTDNSSAITELMSYNNGTTLYLAGNLAMTKMYNKVLSSAEVLQNYNATKGRFNL